MDFGALLHTAQKNEKVGKKEGVRFYSTKFEPPKKEQRNKQQLSENIKKFLAKKEAEENERKLEANRKKEELLALRAKDKKATRRVNVMLKRTKSANQSVIQDAVDENNTSVTLAGPIQPDEDDYGYVSQEAAAFYNKMMEKYSKMPDEPKFNSNRKKISTDLISTKERVKAAIEREKEEANMPHRRKRKHMEKEDIVKQDEICANKKPKGVPPPPLNFNDLLKLAEKKQFEPIVIEQKPKEEQRLLTKKQKKEVEREREWRERRENKPIATPEPTSNKIPKVAQKPINQIAMRDVKKNLSSTTTVLENTKKLNLNKTEKKSNVPSSVLTPGCSANKTNAQQKGPEERKEIYRVTTKDIQPKKKTVDHKSKQFPQSDTKHKQFSQSDQKLKQLPSSDVKLKQFPPSDSRPKTQFHRDFKPKQFSTVDVKRNNIKEKLNKRRILDEEYDSEMDDFIDDGPEEEEDYSKYISEIFGYDKSKYRHVDDDVDNMESSFAQQMREEVISTKIGIMEDLEDMKKEEEEKRQKALLRKKRKM